MFPLPEGDRLLGLLAKIGAHPNLSCYNVNGNPFLATGLIFTDDGVVSGPLTCKAVNVVLHNDAQHQYIVLTNEYTIVSAINCAERAIYGFDSMTAFKDVQISDMKANFTIERETPSLVIVDRGPWDRHLTVTNDIENVVELLVQQKLLPSSGDELFFYFDAEGELSGATVRDGKFRCFFFPNESDRMRINA